MKGNLDSNLLESGQFLPQLSDQKIVTDVVQPTIDLFSVQVKQRKIAIVMKTNGNKDKIVKIDKLRT